MSSFDLVLSNKLMLNIQISFCSMFSFPCSITNINIFISVSTLVRHHIQFHLEEIDCQPS